MAHDPQSLATGRRKVSVESTPALSESRIEHMAAAGEVELEGIKPRSSLPLGSTDRYEAARCAARLWRRVHPAVAVDPRIACRKTAPSMLL